jgi:hypothetical protein
LLATNGLLQIRGIGQHIKEVYKAVKFLPGYASSATWLPSPARWKQGVYA